MRFTVTITFITKLSIPYKYDTSFPPFYSYPENFAKPIHLLKISTFYRKIPLHHSKKRPGCIADNYATTLSPSLALSSDSRHVGVSFFRVAVFLSRDSPLVYAPLVYCANRKKESDNFPLVCNKCKEGLKSDGGGLLGRRRISGK